MSNFSRSGHFAKSRLEMEVLPIESDFSSGSTDKSREDNLLDSESDNDVITEFAGNLTDVSVEQPAFRFVRTLQALTSNDVRLPAYTISDSRRVQELTSIALSFVPKAIQETSEVHPCKSMLSSALSSDAFTVLRAEHPSD